MVHTCILRTDNTKTCFISRLSNGGEYLFQSHDDQELNAWVTAINSAAGGPEGAEGGRAQTLPASSASGSGESKKKGGFFTLKGKK